MWKLGIFLSDVFFFLLLVLRYIFSFSYLVKESENARALDLPVSSQVLVHAACLLEIQGFELSCWEIPPN